jgi:hypothetical protein
VHMFPKLRVAQCCSYDCGIAQPLGCAMLFGSTENQWVTSCTNLLHNPNLWQHVCAQLALAPQ